VIGKKGIFTAHIHDAGAWRHKAERLHLFEKRTIEIKVAACAQLVPDIAPPHLLIIDGAGLFRRVNRDDFFAGFVAFAMIQFAFIAKGESTLLATIRAKSGGREENFFTIKNRGNFF
jgi:hypothetical protein